MSGGPSVVVALGEDEGTRALAVEAALEEFAASHRVSGPGASDLLVERIEANDEFEPAFREASTPPLTGEPKAVVVERRSIAISDAEKICKWLKRASVTHEGAPPVLLVFSCERVPSGKARSLLEDCGVSLRSHERPSHQDLPEFVSQLARKEGLNLAPDAAAALGSAVGSDVSAIRSAIAQLLDAYSSAGSTSRIGLAEVEALFEPARHDPPWVLISAIERGDAGEALLSLKGFFDGGYHPLQVLAILYTSCRRIAYVASSDAAHKEILASMKLPPGAKARISKLARRLGPEKARRLVTEIAGAELDAKGRSGLDARTVAEKLVVTLCEICGQPDRSGGRKRSSVA
jgi:DNA polymerase III delta subunit